MIRNRSSNRTIRRQQRTRARVRGSQDRPRLSVFRSGRHIFVQLINDETGTTIAAVSDREFSGGKKSKKLPSRLERARWVGEEIAGRAKTKGVSRGRFDRGSYRYHGLIQAVAEGARKGGLQL